MDLNQLFYCHQVSVMRAESARSSSERHRFIQSAGGYADRITAIRHKLGAGTRLTLAS